MLAAILLASMLTGSETPVSAPVVDAAPFTRARPRIAAGTQQSLAVWMDWRTPKRDVRGTRIGRGGEVLDPLGILIAPAESMAADVATNGDGYLVASQSFISDTTTVTAVSASGAVTPGISLPGVSAVLASNGRDYLLAYERGEAGFGARTVYARRLGPDGLPIGPELTIFSRAQDAVIASNGDVYIVAALFPRTLLPFEGIGTAAIVDDSGVKVRDIQFARSSHYLGRDNFSVASDGTDFRFVFGEENSAENQQSRISLQTCSISASGVVGGKKMLLAESASPMLQAPSIAWNGSRYVVTLALRAMEVSSAGDVERQPFFIDERGSTQDPSRVAAAGGEVLVVYVDDNNNVKLARLPAGELELISRSVTTQEEPVAVPYGDGDLAVWTERIGPGHRRALFAGPGIAVAESAREQFFPALSAAPQPLVAWIEQGGSVNATLKVAPALGGKEALVLGLAAQNAKPAILWNGSVHVVVWNPPERGLVAVRLTASGERIDATPITLRAPRPNPLAEIEPALAWNGERFLLAFISYEVQVCPFVCPFGTHLLALALDSDLRPIGAPAEVADSTTSRPQVVWNGTEFAIFLTDNFSIQGRRLNANGIALDTQAAIISRGRPFITSAAWDGSRYLIASESLELGPLQPTITRTDPQLHFLSAQPLDIDDQRRTNLVLVRNGGAVDAVYQRFTPDAPFLGISRVLTRRLTAPPRRRAR